MRPEDRRKYIRVDITSKTEFKTAGGINGKALTQNISASGIRLLSNKKLDNGDLIDLKIFIKGSARPIYAKGQITWVKKIDIQGSTCVYDVGIRFTEIDKADDKRFFEYIFDLMQSDFENLVRLRRA